MQTPLFGQNPVQPYYTRIKEKNKGFDIIFKYVSTLNHFSVPVKSYKVMMYQY